MLYIRLLVCSLSFSLNWWIWWNSAEDFAHRKSSLFASTTYWHEQIPKNKIYWCILIFFSEPSPSLLLLLYIRMFSIRSCYFFSVLFTFRTLVCCSVYYIETCTNTYIIFEIDETKWKKIIPNHITYMKLCWLLQLAIRQDIEIQF